MKLRKLFLSFLFITALICVVGCNDNNEETPPVVEKDEFSVTFESNGGSSVPSQTVKKDGLVTKPENPTKDGYKFMGWYKEANFGNSWIFEEDKVTSDTTIYAKWIVFKPTVKFNTNGGSKVDEVQLEYNSVLEEPEIPTKTNYKFDGWYINEDLTEKYDFSKEVKTDLVLYAKWIDLYEKLTYTLLADDLEAKVYEEDYISTRFTVLANTTVRNRTKSWTNPEDASDVKTFNKSVKMGDDKSKVVVDVPGNGKLSIYVQNGSSGLEYQYIVVTNIETGDAQTIKFDGTVSSSPIVKIDLDVEKGKYQINRQSGTIDVYLLELECTVERGEVVGFEIASSGVTNFIEGQAYDPSKIQLYQVYDNGRLDIISINDENVKLDTSKYNPNIAGKYEIKVQFKNYEPQVIVVEVLEISDIILGFDSIKQIANSSAGNGVYFNYSVQEVYKLNDEFNKEGLNVIIVAVDSENKEYEFKMNSNIDITGFDSASAGEKTINVRYSFGDNDSVGKEFKVYVVDTQPFVDEDGIYQLRVDQNYNGVVGNVVDNKNMFTSIQQALDYISINDIPASSKKIVSIAEGEYKEKLEITIPYLSLIGDGANKVLIEWDSLYGLEDEGGFVHTTDSTSTVAIRDQAIGCNIDGVTISNFWNSKERFDEYLYPDYPEHRALALLVQSDQFTMKNSKLLGYQDTLELFTGRQYFENVYISGLTDFIFGTNNTTYFKNCEIHSISVGKTDGGYLTAFKGNNKGSGDYIKYGAIFDGCDFTAPESEIKNGNTAIGRCWGPYAAVMIMNSNIAGHISTKGSTGSSKNERYVSMNALPTDATVQFTEYNNTGAGAINEAVAGMKLLTAEEAAKYADFNVIFGTSNGAVTYINAWDPSSTEIVVDRNIYYNFNGTQSPTGTNYTYDQTIEKATGTFGEMEIDATNSKVAARASDTQINKGAILRFKVDANSIVIIKTYQGYHDYSINGISTTLDDFSIYFKDATDVEIVTNAQVYLYSIIIKPDQEAPEEAILKSISISGQTTSFVVGDEFKYDELVVKANYSDGSYRVLSKDDYSVTLDKEISGAGIYIATVKYVNLEAQYEVEYVDSGVDPTVISTNTSITFGTEGNYKDSKIVIADETQIRDNGGNNTQIKCDTTIKVLANATIKVSSYSGYTNYKVLVNGVELEVQTGTEYTFSVEEDAEVIFRPTDGNNYLYSITVSYPVDLTIKENTSITFGTEGNYKDSKIVIADETQIRDNGGNNTQIKCDTTIKVLANATIKVSSYSGYTNYKVLVNGVESEVQTGTEYTFSVEEDAEVIFRPTDGNNYLYSITVSYPVDLTIKENTSITFGAEGNYKDSKIVIADETQIRDNGGNNTQIKCDTTIKVLANATIKVSSYSGYTNYKVLVNGVESEVQTGTEYTFSVEEDAEVIFRPTDGNNYLYSITVSY